MKRREFLGKSIPAATLLPALINGYSVKAFAADSPLVQALMQSTTETDHVLVIIQLSGGNDGLKIDRNGNVFATGPGGIWIFNQNGNLLGKLRLNEASSNVALSPDEKTLYITNDMYIVRFKMR